MKVVIVGNGVAGITCAKRVRERNPSAEITVVSGETEYFFSRTALMYAYMDIMKRKDLEPHERSFYREQRINLIKDWVIDCNATTKQIFLKGGTQLSYDKLVLAVGAKANLFSWEGIDEVQEGLVHFVSMQDLDNCERLTPSTKRAVVVGGGLIGIELVECLRHHGVEVTFLVREPFYWPIALSEEEADTVSAEIRHHGVDLRYNEEMVKVETNAQGRVSKVITNKGDEIECQMLGITAGVKPNIDLLKDFSHKPEMNRGIVVNEFFETSLPDVYAAGDCAEIHLPGQEKPTTELIWYSAKRHGEYVANNICDDKKTYEPPLFFNSSKFFEVEYTTVGEVMTLPTGTPSIYRKMPKEPISQRIVHDGEKVLGFNMLGSRWDHEVLENWIHEKRGIDYVLRHLHQAQYDVEFGQASLARMSETELPIVNFRDRR